MTALTKHPTSPPVPVEAVDADARVTAAGDLALSFTLTGDLDGLRIPAPSLARHRDGLWRHTCFEAFVGSRDGTAYVEVNLSPSGAWAAYTFRAYRDGVVLELDGPPDIVCDIEPGGLRLTATLAQQYLPGSGQLRVGLSAVVEDAEGRLSHWALRHPPGQPDFHHTDGFDLELARA